MFPVEAFRSTVEKFVQIATALELPFHLTGGSISSAYGEPRLTQDIDIVISPAVARAKLDQLLEQLSQSDFMFSETAVRSAILTGELFQLLDNTESLKLDLYPRELIAGELDRSEPVEIFNGLSLPVVSRIDAAASKLIWVQKGSHRSRRDLRSIFRNSDEMQQEQIRALAMKFGLNDLLQEVLRESDEIR
ncbi:MAG: nucleotidyl transferase AbiEii/AbiGii toxin family protein [Pirellulales bacterium]